jgi:hypothetical protein
MDASHGIGRGTHRRPPLRRLVLAAVLLVVLAEPIVMYRSLEHERAQRRVAAVDMFETGR